MGKIALLGRGQSVSLNQDASAPKCVYRSQGKEGRTYRGVRGQAEEEVWVVQCKALNLATYLLCDLEPIALPF